MPSAKEVSSSCKELPQDDAQDIYHELYDDDPDIHLLTGVARFKELFEDIKFYQSTLVHRLTVAKGVTPWVGGIKHAGLSSRVWATQLSNILDLPRRILIHRARFLRHLGRGDINLTRLAFSQLLEATNTPPPFLEALSNNNGFYSSHQLSESNNNPTDYYVLIKLPFGPFANGSVYLHHDHQANRTTCIISATNVLTLVERFVEICPPVQSSQPPSRRQTHCESQLRPSPHPLTPLVLFQTHIQQQNESHREDIDKLLCHLESRSGITLHGFGSRPRAKISEYALLKRDVHMQEARMAMAMHCFTFQEKFGQWVAAEMRLFKLLPGSKIDEPSPQKQDAAIGIQIEAQESVRNHSSRNKQSDYILASLDLNASAAMWSVEQLKALGKRLKVQSRVIDSTIAATDTLTMIRLAQSSRSDSNTMKAITVLTMVFLPATFVCSLFGTGFFDFGFGSESSAVSPASGLTSNEGSGTQIKVAQQFWVYFAVTVPLTVVVLGICVAWLRWGGGDGEGEELDSSRGHVFDKRNFGIKKQK